MVRPENPATPGPPHGRPSLLGAACAGASAAAFLLSPEAGLGAGVAALVLLFLLSPRRELDFGLLLLVLGLGILAAARSFYPGLGALLAGGYLLARGRWGPGAPRPVPVTATPGPRSRVAARRAGGAREGGAAASLLANRTFYELVTALGAVALVVALLQQGTATWPAMVAVESCSMEPNIRVGDLVVVMGPIRSPIATQGGDLVRVERAPPPGTGSGSPGGPTPSGGSNPPGGPNSIGGAGGAREPPLSAEVLRGEGAGERSFALATGCTAERPDGGGCAARGEPVAGDVIVFYPNGNAACTPIIHRARAWVGDNGTYEGRSFTRGGFITKGDNNGPLAGQSPAQAADQWARGGTPVCPNTEPVRPEWMVGVAKFRIPWLGYVRLLLNPSNWPKSCAAGS